MGQEYFYLFVGGVLCFVENDEGVVECVFVYEGEWCDFDDFVCQVCFEFFLVEYVLQ